MSFLQKSLSLLAILAILSSTTASPVNFKSRAQLRKREVTRLSSGKTTGKYIVGHIASSSKKTIVDSLDVHIDDTNVLKELMNLNSFVVQANNSALDTLLSHDHVMYVEEEGYVEMDTAQTDATWGLSRLSASGKLNSTDADALNFTYTYDESAGKGIDAYVLDTGIRTTHEQFEGRAKFGVAFPSSLGDGDGNGHGTHVAGTLGGKQFGVAKNVNLIAVHILDGRGSGEASDCLAAIDWVISAAKNSSNPSLASMSLRYDPSNALDDAVKELTQAGVHVIASAGNSGIDASSQSPGRAPEAITVGAIDINDDIASFSNFGPLVDVFAPGDHIISAWATSDNATFADFGTSMATPHISGLVATLISKDGNVSPADMSKKVKNLAQKGLIGKLPDNTTNLIAHNGE